MLPLELYNNGGIKVPKSFLSVSIETRFLGLLCASSYRYTRSVINLVTKNLHLSGNTRLMAGYQAVNCIMPEVD